MEKSKKSSLASIVLAIILIIVGLIITINQLIVSPDKYTSIIMMIVYFVTIIYMCFDYKVPHGNLLKYLFLLFATALALIVCRPDNYMAIVNYLLCAPIILSAYMAGRLNKVKDNTGYIIIIEAILIVVALISMFGSAPADEAAGITSQAALNSTWSTRYMILNPALQFGAIALSYFARFEAHLEAGIQ